MSKVSQCIDCRHWSDRIARCQGDGVGEVEALCLNKASRNFQKYTVDRVTCDKWQEALGWVRVDSPGQEGTYKDAP